MLETGVLETIVKYCEVLSVLLFVSGLAGVAIYYLRYCYHASLIGTVHNYAEPTVLHWSSNLAELKCDGDLEMVEMVERLRCFIKSKLK